MDVWRLECAHLFMCISQKSGLVSAGGWKLMAIAKVAGNHAMIPCNVADVCKKDTLFRIWKCVFYSSKAFWMVLFNYKFLSCVVVLLCPVHVASNWPITSHSKSVALPALVNPSFEIQMLVFSILRMIFCFFPRCLLMPQNWSEGEMYTNPTELKANIEDVQSISEDPSSDHETISSCRGLSMPQILLAPAGVFARPGFAALNSRLLGGLNEAVGLVQPRLGDTRGIQ